MYKNAFIIILLLCGIFLNSTINAQEAPEKEFLQGLVKVSNGELGSMQIMMDGETFPIYNMDDERVQGMKMMEYMMSGDFVPEFYMNDQKEIKAAVLRKATEDEKKMIKKMQGQAGGGMGKSELLGKEAIAFTGKDINGNEVDLASLQGKIIVMNFWFVECKPCVMEMPELNELVEHYKEEDIVFIGFATNKKAQIKSFIKKNPFDYQIIPSSGPICQSYGVNSFPTHIIIGKDSKIAFVTSGLGPTTISDIEQTIESLLK